MPTDDRTISPNPPTPASRLDGMGPYEPPASRFEIDLRLDANEGPEPAPALIDSLRTLDGEALRRYPDVAALEARLAERLGVTADRVIVTNGGDDAIDRICRATLEPGRSALVHDPTFVMIPHSSRLAGADVVTIPWRGGAFPRDAFLDAMTERTALVSLVTPNNPTGGVVETPDLLAIVEKAEALGVTVLVDLAYIEFADEDPTPLLIDRPNVVMVRTFSKARSLAGLRVGYAVGSTEMVRWLRTAGGPFPVSNLSAGVAVRSLDLEDQTNAAVAQVRQQRDELFSLLTELGAEPMASQGNFVTARVRDAGFLADQLASLGIGVRTFPGKPSMDGLVRITLPGGHRTTDGHEAFGRLCAALRAALRPEALLFDMDGVIADVSGSYRTAIRHTAASFGVEVTQADIAAVKAAGNANNDWVVTHRLLAERGVDRPYEEVVERFQELYMGVGDQPGLRETEASMAPPGYFERLGERLVLAIVTGRPFEEATWFLDRVGLGDRFPWKICMEDGPPKPSPIPVREAIARTGTPTAFGIGAAWMIGDTVDDIVAARAAGVIPIGIVAPEDDPDRVRATLEAAGAARVVTSLDELEALLP